MKPYAVIEWDGTKEAKGLRVFEIGIESRELAEKAVQRHGKSGAAKNISHVQYVSHSEFCYLFGTEPGMHKIQRPPVTCDEVETVCPVCGSELCVILTLMEQTETVWIKGDLDVTDRTLVNNDCRYRVVCANDESHELGEDVWQYVMDNRDALFNS